MRSNPHSHSCEAGAAALAEVMVCLGTGVGSGVANGVGFGVGSSNVLMSQPAANPTVTAFTVLYVSETDIMVWTGSLDPTGWIMDGLSIILYGRHSKMAAANWRSGLQGAVLASLASTGAVVANAFHQKKQFYPAVVMITNSNVSMLVRWEEAPLAP